MTEMVALTKTLDVNAVDGGMFAGVLPVVVSFPAFSSPDSGRVLFSSTLPSLLMLWLFILIHF